jgi:hypothetical protein
MDTNKERELANENEPIGIPFCAGLEPSRNHVLVACHLANHLA